MICCKIRGQLGSAHGKWLPWFALRVVSHRTRQHSMTSPIASYCRKFSRISFVSHNFPERAQVELTLETAHKTSTECLMIEPNEARNLHTFQHICEKVLLQTCQVYNMYIYVQVLLDSFTFSLFTPRRGVGEGDGGRGVGFQRRSAMPAAVRRSSCIATIPRCLGLACTSSVRCFYTSKILPTSV